jgi:hypothetical protein
MRRFALVLCVLVGCGDSASVPTADARLEGFDEPDIVCPGGPDCEASDGELFVGVGKRAWTPTIRETFTDENMDWEWSSDEPFDDVNGNGKFDAVWVFGGGRAAQGVISDVEARAIAFEQGDMTIVVLSLDAVGLLSPDMDRIRTHANLAGLDVDHIVVTSTHAHNAPDTIGLWGPQATTTGRVDFVLQSLYDNASLAVKDALANMQPAHLTIAATKLLNDPANPLSMTDDFNKDIRDPVIFDPTLTIARFTRANAPTETIATLVNWADHPEIQNFANEPTKISAHYVHWLRKGIEDGVLATETPYSPTDLPGLGGTTVFVQGALGGQIGSIRGTHPLDPSGAQLTTYNDGFEKAIGMNAAAYALKALAASGESTSDLPLSFKSAVFHGRIENTFLNVAFLVGLLGKEEETQGVLVGYDPDEALDVGNYPWIKLRSTFIQVGPLGLVTVPGELHPELWVGGYDGSWSWGWPLYDNTKPNLPQFDQAPEPPYMRDLVLAHPGVRYPICIGLGENYIGYIVPAYNYALDPENPYINEAEGDHYEEVYSLSPLVEQHAIHPILDLLKYRP